MKRLSIALVVVLGLEPSHEIHDADSCSDGKRADVIDSLRRPRRHEISQRQVRSRLGDCYAAPPSAHEFRNRLRRWFRRRTAHWARGSRRGGG